MLPARFDRSKQAILALLSRFQRGHDGRQWTWMAQSTAAPGNRIDQTEDPES
jgi:hypothetical protein